MKEKKFNAMLYDALGKSDTIRKKIGLVADVEKPRHDPSSWESYVERTRAQEIRDFLVRAKTLEDRVEKRLERLEKHFQLQDDVIAKIASQVQVREQIPEEGFPVSIGTVVKILLEHLNLHFVIEPRKIRLVKDSGQSCCEARDRRKK